VLSMPRRRQQPTPSQRHCRSGKRLEWGLGRHPERLLVADLRRALFPRHGFGWTSGALLALALRLAERTVAHQLLIVLAAFIAIGLDPAVAFLVGATCAGESRSR